MRQVADGLHHALEAQVGDLKNAMPMRSTPLMNRVSRSTRKKSGDANSRSKNFQPAHGLPNRPPVTVNCFQASTMPAIGT